MKEMKQESEGGKMEVCVHMENQQSSSFSYRKRNADSYMSYLHVKPCLFFKTGGLSLIYDLGLCRMILVCVFCL